MKPRSMIVWRSIKSGLALTMWGAKVRLISTHNGVDNLFNELITDSRAGKKRYSVHRLTLDDAWQMAFISVSVW